MKPVYSTKIIDDARKFDLGISPSSFELISDSEKVIIRSNDDLEENQLKAVIQELTLRRKNEAEEIAAATKQKLYSAIKQVAITLLSLIAFMRMWPLIVALLS